MNSKTQASTAPLAQMRQLILNFDTLPPLAIPLDVPANNEERFQQFHAKNPQVYRALKSMALQLYAQGHRRYGMKAMFEILRWQSRLSTVGEPYKLNNIFTAYYARLLMDEVPELAGFFEVRGTGLDTE